jgi:hypothetical protein
MHAERAGCREVAEFCRNGEITDCRVAVSPISPGMPRGKRRIHRNYLFFHMFFGTLGLAYGLQRRGAMARGTLDISMETRTGHFHEFKQPTQQQGE